MRERVGRAEEREAEHDEQQLVEEVDRRDAEPRRGRCACAAREPDAATSATIAAAPTTQSHGPLASASTAERAAR